jgi:hypothetical protein
MLNLRIPSLLRSSAYVVLVALLASLSGCYNTYRVAPDEFRKLQSATAVGEDAKLQAKISAEELTKLQTRGENEPVAVT